MIRLIAVLVLPVLALSNDPSDHPLHPSTSSTPASGQETPPNQFHPLPPHAQLPHHHLQSFTVKAEEIFVRVPAKIHRDFPASVDLETINEERAKIKAEIYSEDEKEELGGNREDAEPVEGSEGLADTAGTPMAFETILEAYLPQATDLPRYPIKKGKFDSDRSCPVAKSAQECYDKAKPCEEKGTLGKTSGCTFPNCFCSKDATLGPFAAKGAPIPQMVMLTFDGPINGDNIDFYRYLFDGDIPNPDGCPIRGTFFVQLPNSDFSLINDLYRRKNEIGLLPVEFALQEEDEADLFNSTFWIKDLELLKNGKLNRTYIPDLARIPYEDFVGFRADDKFILDREHYPEIDGHFMYDASVRDQTPQGQDAAGEFHWPQTLHRQLSFECRTRGGAAKCPTKSANLWLIPENDLVFKDSSGNASISGRCRGLESCDEPFNPVTNEKNFNDLLTYSLSSHRKTGAPMEIRIPVSFFERNPANVRLLKNWIKLIQTSQKDVHFVTMAEAILFMQNSKVNEQGDIEVPKFHGQKCQVEHWEEPCQRYELRLTSEDKLKWGWDSDALYACKP